MRISDLGPYAGGVSGNPDFQQGAVNVNAQFRWEYLTGSTLALVYARTQYPGVSLGTGENGVLATRSIGRAPGPGVHPRLVLLGLGAVRTRGQTSARSPLTQRRRQSSASTSRELARYSTV